MHRAQQLVRCTACGSAAIHHPADRHQLKIQLVNNVGMSKYPEKVWDGGNCMCHSHSDVLHESLNFLLIY